MKSFQNKFQMFNWKFNYKILSSIYMSFISNSAIITSLFITLALNFIFDFSRFVNTIFNNSQLIQVDCNNV